MTTSVATVAVGIALATAVLAARLPRHPTAAHDQQPLVAPSSNRTADVL
jgi:hypothetical protein